MNQVFYTICQLYRYNTYVRKYMTKYRVPKWYTYVLQCSVKIHL
jgi:hypothetical protein